MMTLQNISSYILLQFIYIDKNIFSPLQSLCLVFFRLWKIYAFYCILYKDNDDECDELNQMQSIDLHVNMFFVKSYSTKQSR